MNNSYRLKEHLSELSGNVKIVIKNNNEATIQPIFVEKSSINALNAKMSITSSSNYFNDLSQYLKTMGGKGIVTKKRSEDKNLYNFWLEGKIFDTIVIAKKIEGKYIIKNIYDYSESTNVGAYLKRTAEKTVSNPITVNKENGQIEIDCFDTFKGSIIKSTSNIRSEEDLDNYVVQRMYRKNLILTNCISIELPYSLEEGEEIFFTNKILFSSFLSPQQMLRTRKLNLTEEIPGGRLQLISDNISGKFGISNKHPLSHLEGKDSFSNISYENKSNVDKLNITYNLGRSFNIKPVNNIKVRNLLNIKEKFQQNDSITIVYETVREELIFDSLPNYIANGNVYNEGDHFDKIVNPTGSLNDQINSVCGSWNERFFVRTNVQAINYNGRLLFLGGSRAKGVITVVSDKLESTERNEESFEGKSFFNVAKGTVSKGEDLLLEDQYKVLQVFSNLEKLNNFNGVIDFENISKFDYVMTEKNNFSGKFTTTIEKKSINYYVHDIFDYKSISKVEEIGGVVYDSEDIEEIYPIELVVGRTYKLISQDSKIDNNGAVYFTGDTFESTSTSFKVLKGKGIIIDQDFIGDVTLENYSKELVYNTKVENKEIQFASYGNTGVDGNVLPMYSQKEIGKNDLPNISANTNEWFNSGISTFTGWFGIAKCVLNGIEFRLSNKYVGYTLEITTDILPNTDNTDENYKGIPYKIRFDESEKNVKIIMNIVTKDYRWNREKVNKLLMYISSSEISEPTSSIFGEEYDYSYPNNITSDQVLFRGILMPFKSLRIKENNIVTSITNSLARFITPNVSGNVNIIGIDVVNKTYVSTKGYFGYQGKNKKIVLGKNTIGTEDGKIFVTAIGGIPILAERTFGQISQLVQWSSLTWYQIEGGFNYLSNLRKMMNYSFFKESVNLNKENVIYETILGGLVQDGSQEKMTISNDGKKFSGRYTLKTINLKSFSGNKLESYWSLFDKKWDQYNANWTELEEIHNLETANNINDE